MATLSKQNIHWRDQWTERSEAISDFWQVILAYAGRFAEIVLFLCMIISIVEMAPNFHMWDWLSNGTLITQMITLDIAGFGLNSMAKYVRRGGDEVIAKKAETIGYYLISIMVASLLTVGIKLIFGSFVHGLNDWVGYIDDGLILVRIVATVFYGHVIHSLRDAKQFIQAEAQEKKEDLQAEIMRLQNLLQTEKAQSAGMQNKLQTELLETRADFKLQIETLTQSQNATLQTAENQNGVVQNLQNQLREALQNCSLQTAKLDQKQNEIDLQNTKLQTALADLQSAKLQIASLQNDLQKTSLQTAGHVKLQTVNNVTPFAKKAESSARAKLSHAEIMKFKSENPKMKNAEVAAALQISERKLYDAVAWQREQAQ